MKNGWIKQHWTESQTVGQTLHQTIRENDRPDNQDEDEKMRGQWEMMTVGFTAIKGVPGVRLEHVCSVLLHAASLHTLGLSLLWEMDVTGQGLRDVVDTVHLQTGLVWEIQGEWGGVRERIRKTYYALAVLLILLADTFDVSYWKENIMHIIYAASS